VLELAVSFASADGIEQVATLALDESQRRLLLELDDEADAEEARWEAEMGAAEKLESSNSTERNRSHKSLLDGEGRGKDRPGRLARAQRCGAAEERRWEAEMGLRQNLASMAMSGIARISSHWMERGEARIGLGVWGAHAVLVISGARWRHITSSKILAADGATRIFKTLRARIVPSACSAPSATANCLRTCSSKPCVLMTTFFSLRV
jgi:hypothetical protein